MKLYTLQFENSEDYLLPACIFSSSPIGSDDESKLRFGQTVVEGQWLNYNEIPCFLMLLSDTSIGTMLYNNVRLINPKDWGSVVDKTDAFLLNKPMYDLCKDSEALFIGLQHFSGEALTELFSDHMFIVAGVH